ncbi:hypothetical protein ACHAWF_008672 [Thalassiosira exigua]
MALSPAYFNFCWLLFLLSFVSAFAKMGLSRTLWDGQIHRSIAEDGFNDLQSMYSLGGNRTSSDGPSQSAARNKMDSTKHLFATASRFKNAADALDEICKALGDPQASRTKIKESSRLVKKHIIPLLDHAANTMDETATVLAPIGNMTYLHERKETELKHEKERKRKGDGIAGGTFSPPNAKRSLRATNHVTPSKDPASNYPLPEPARGKEYSKQEVRGQAVKAIIAHQKLYNIPCSRKTINRLMSKHAKGEVIAGDWGWGLPKFCTSEELRR